MIYFNTTRPCIRTNQTTTTNTYRKRVYTYITLQMFVFREINIILYSLLISPSAAYMGQWIGSVLVQIMACYLFGA